jgi:hypothetical protein
MGILSFKNKRIPQLIEAAQLANASYDGEAAPTGWHTENLSSFLKNGPPGLKFNGPGFVTESGSGYMPGSGALPSFHCRQSAKSDLDSD